MPKLLLLGGLVVASWLLKAAGEAMHCCCHVDTA